MRFAAPARREFLNEVAFYNGREPGLGARFTAAVGEAATRAMAFPLSGSRASANTRRVFVRDFPFASVYRHDEKGSSSSPSRTIRVAPIAGSLPGCVATGTTVAEVEGQSREAVAFHVEDLREDGVPIPAPSSQVEYIDVASWHRHLHGGRCAQPVVAPDECSEAL